MVSDFKTYSKLLLAIAVTGILAGCVSPGLKPSIPKETEETPANEALLKAASNHAGLIQLYKTRLSQAKTPEEQKSSRLQLAGAYLETGDPESTLFTLEPLISGVSKDSEVWLLKARAVLAMGELETALMDINQSLSLAPESPTTLNQQGVIYASMGQYNQARQSFNKARTTMFDDLVIKNNLAMLDILEKKYDAAIQRLMPLYTSGQADERIKANLSLALARAGLYNEFKTVHSEARSEQEKLSLFMTLSSATPAAHIIK